MFKESLQKTSQFSFCYQDSLNMLPYQADIVVNPSAENTPFIDKMAHFARIRALEEALEADIEIKDLMYYVKVVDKKA